jgi:hypothetical protein
MAVYVSNITIPIGSDFEQTFSIENVNDTPLNLTVYTGAAALKKHPASLAITAPFEVSFPDRVNGKVKISLGSSITSSIRPGRYSYDLVLFDGSKTSRVIEGSALVTPGVTVSGVSTVSYSSSYSIGGSQGIQGITGFQGIQGTSGEAVFQGLQGIQGNAGTLGTQGIQGAQGIQGTQGIQGQSGTASFQGIQGIQGFSGAVGLSSRNVLTASTGVLGIGATTNLEITGHKSYLLQKIETSAGSWVTIYTDSTSRTNDSTRNQDTDPLPGSGVISEFISTSYTSQKFTPGVIGFNDDSPVSEQMYLKVVNNSGVSTDISLSLTVLKLEI